MWWLWEGSVSAYWPECVVALVKQYMKSLSPPSSLDSPALLTTGGDDSWICSVVAFLGGCETEVLYDEE